VDGEWGHVTEAQPLIAAPLLAFDDPKAQQAAEELITDKKLLEAEKKTMKENGARGLL